MNKIIVGILVTLVGSAIGYFGLTDACSTEIMAKVTPFIATLPGLVIAWSGVMGEKGRNLFGAKKE